LLATFTVTNTGDGGPGSLRDAIEQANANPGADDIDFDIDGGGPHTIQVSTALPAIDEAVTIDGYTQPGAQPNSQPIGADAVLLIEIQPSRTVADGLVIRAGDTAIRGLVINGFTQSGIHIFGDDAANNVIAGNYIGTDSTGLSAAGNGSGAGAGIIVDAGLNTIGGAAPADRNVISGNFGYGVNVTAQGGSEGGNAILGNYIGVGADGRTPLRNTLDGVRLASPGNVVGGANSGEGNVISGNGAPLGTSTSFEVDLEAVDLAAGDIDGQVGGSLAVASADQVDNSSIQFYRNDGGGQFTLFDRLFFDFAEQPTAITASGSTFYASTSFGRVVVARGDAGGFQPTFLPPAQVGFNPLDLAVGDLNNDSIEDIIIINGAFSIAPSDVRVLFGNADGTFQDPVIVDTGIDPNAVAYLPSDPGGATRPGIVAISSATDEVFIYRSDNGAFQPPVTFAAGVDPSAVAVGDVFNGDSIPDIAVANEASSTVASLIQSDQGAFQVGPTFDVGSGPISVGIGDLNGDGIPDLSTSNQGNIGGSLSLIPQGPDGNFRPTETQAIPGSAGPLAVAPFEIAGSQDGIALLNDRARVLLFEASAIPAGGVLVEDAPGNAVLGNLVGLGADGSTEIGNVGSGVFVRGSEATRVGGLAAGEGNVVSGNQASGVRLEGAASRFSRVEGNRIGVDQTGDFARENFESGVHLVGDVDEVGITGNQISGNGADGLTLEGVFDPSLDLFETPDFNTITGNLIGLNASGDAALGNRAFGVHILNGNSNTIGGASEADRNVISGNSKAGMLIDGSGGADFGVENLVRGNLVGTDGSGAEDLGNGEGGVLILNSGSNRIGGLEPGDGNVISGNTGDGIGIRGSGSVGNRILGNTIGGGSNGLSALGNDGVGVLVANGAHGTIIGGGTDGAGNHIVANLAGVGIATQTQAGLNAEQAETFTQRVQGNRIGVGRGGLALPNELAGVVLHDTRGVLVGGAADQLEAEQDGRAGNIIASGTGAGVWVLGPGSSGNVVQGNAIGSDFDAESFFTSSGIGVLVEFEAHGNIIGGGGPGEGNTIVAHQTAGVALANFASRNSVAGNAIGATGSSGIGNLIGVVIQTAASENVVRDNTISGNTDGVRIHVGATGNEIIGNRIGTDPSGQVARRNAGVGVVINNSSGNWIGGPSTSDQNIISGQLQGVLIEGSLAFGNVIDGNLIGLNADSTAAIPNLLDGVAIDNAPNNIIGGEVGNTISGNGSVGVQISGAGATNNSVLGNRIGLGPDGETPFPNGQVGVFLNNASGNRVGGDRSQDRNIISANGSVGVQIVGGVEQEFVDGLQNGEEFLGNTILGNFIGTDASGQAARPNGTSGIFLDNAAGTQIGGPNPGDGNLISGHSAAGIQIVGLGATGNTIQGNRIGTNAEGTQALPNTHGVTLDNAPGNRIGGPDLADGNLISGNQVGLVIARFGASSNVVRANVIGTTADGLSPLPNRQGGVFINGAPGNQIGGTTPEQANVISGNGFSGLQIFSNQATGNRIVGNRIGLDRAGTRAIPNDEAGIFVNSAPGNQIGGGAPGEGNIIAGNRGSGLVLAGEPAQGNVVEGNVIGAPSGDAPRIFGNDVGLFLNGVAVVPDDPERVNRIQGNRVTDTLFLAEGGGPLVAQADVLTDPTGLRVTGLLLAFNQEMDPTRAERLTNYAVEAAPRIGGRARMTRAVYNNADRSVRLFLNRSVPITSRIRLLVNGRPPRGLTNTDGLPLDGDANGGPGENFVALFRNGELVRAPGLIEGRERPSASGIDALFTGGAPRFGRRRG